MSSYAAITLSAVQLLQEQGYAGTTINALRRRAGVSPGTLYHYFPAPTSPAPTSPAPTSPAPTSPAPSTRDQVVGRALGRSLQIRTERLIESLRVETPALQWALGQARPSCPLARFAQDSGIIEHPMHGATLRAAVDEVRAALAARHPDAPAESIDLVLVLLLGASSLARITGTELETGERSLDALLRDGIRGPVAGGEETDA